MEKEFDYTFKKMYPYIETSVLKLKEVNSIITVITNGRLKHLIEFEGYGICEYDEEDRQLINTHVTMMDKFNRLKTNVMVFKVYDNDWTMGMYDKLFIFKTNWVKEPTLNFVLCNTKTGKFMHHPEIEFAYDILAQDLMKAFNTIHKQEIFNFHANKIQCSKEGKFNDFAKEVNYGPIIERYCSAQWDDPNAKTSDEFEIQAEVV